MSSRGRAGGGVLGKAGACVFAVAAWHSVERSLITQGFSEWVVKPLPVAIVSMFASLRLVATVCVVRVVRCGAVWCFGKRAGTNVVMVGRYLERARARHASHRCRRYWWAVEREQ